MIVARPGVYTSTKAMESNQVAWGKRSDQVGHGCACNPTGIRDLVCGAPRCRRLVARSSTCAWLCGHAVQPALLPTLLRAT
jgi:hypothetical protein